MIMQKITSVAGLKSAIQTLEIEQSIKGCLLKEQLFLTYESLKPINLIRNTLKELFSSQFLMDDVSGSAMGAVSGFLLKKLFVGASATKFRKLIGSVLQFGITNFITQNSDQIKSFALALFQHFFTDKKKNSKKRARRIEND
jgi:hypothetical protein